MSGSEGPRGRTQESHGFLPRPSCHEYKGVWGRVSTQWRSPTFHPPWMLVSNPPAQQEGKGQPWRELLHRGSIYLCLSFDLCWEGQAEQTRDSSAVQVLEAQAFLEAMPLIHLKCKPPSLCPPQIIVQGKSQSRSRVQEADRVESVVGDLACPDFVPYPSSWDKVHQQTSKMPVSSLKHLLSWGDEGTWANLCDHGPK